MSSGYPSVIDATLATLFTWAVTAAGASLIIFLPKEWTLSQTKGLLDSSLGFAAGVMTAASLWSLLLPALSLSESQNDSSFHFLPIILGFLAGCLFVHGADELLNKIGIKYPVNELLVLRERKRRHSSEKSMSRGLSNKRILLLIIAITVHNIPEGLAVGISFGAIGSSAQATYESARNLAIGIAIQNFPEGLAVSLPLKAAGYSTSKSIWYGQLSGVVEPIAGLIGALLVHYMSFLLPYALSFAAGAMIFVVVDDIIPESRASGNDKLSSWSFILGFLVMMSLDVGLS